MAGTDVITSSDSDIPWGFVALSGWQAKFQDLQVGYDPNGDDVIEDVVIGDLFDSTSVSPVYDDNGNLTQDADYAYTYDAWNNLVKVVAQNVSTVVVATYAYFGDDRRASSTVTSRGDLDGAVYYIYDGFRVIQEWDGAGTAFNYFPYLYGQEKLSDTWGEIIFGLCPGCFSGGSGSTGGGSYGPVTNDGVGGPPYP